MDINELKELVRLLEDSALSEIEIEEDNRRVRLSKQWTGAQAAIHYPVGPPPAASAAPAPAGTAAQPAGAEQDDPNALPEGVETIDSPMVGTFYSSPGPGEPPFVLPGTRVEKDQTVCIIEAMKIMNEVGARVACVIEKVLVENGQPVEFGQPLFHVRRAG